MKLKLLIIIIIVCYNCNNNSKNDKIRSIHVASSISERPKQIVFEVDPQDVSIIPLANDDKAYLSQVSVVGVDEKQLVVTSDDKIFFYAVNNGDLLSMIDRKGKGPQEYLNIASSVVDFDKEVITIHDMYSRNLAQYGFKGDFIQKIKNDSIIWLASTDKFFFAFNDPQVATQCQFEIYDKDWNLRKSTSNKESNDAKSDIIRIVGMYNHDNTIYVTINDTLSIFTPEFELEPYLTFDKGSLKCPSEVENDRKNYDLSKSYITSDYATLIGNYIYYRYMYNEHKYQDMWDVNSGKLIGRNIIDGAVDLRMMSFTPKEGQNNGISIKYKDNIINVGDPVYVKGDKTYFVLDQIYVNELGLFDRELNNPVIMSVVFK